MTVDRRSLVAGMSAAILGSRVAAQGFAGLGMTVDGFALPDPAYRLGFPRDHGPHPDFRIEWWYLTANLTDATGRDLGLQWTLFRTALRPDEANNGVWDSPQVWLGHAAVTLPDRHLAAERYGRGGIGQAGAKAAPFQAWIDDWRLGQAEGSPEVFEVAAATPEFSYALRLTQNGPIVLHGDRGYSTKSAQGQASHYYSLPFLSAEGSLSLGDDPPLAVSGTAWIDREWSSQPLAEDQTGWDWFSLVFDEGSRLMAFRLRGGERDFTAATWIGPDGRPDALPDGAVRLSPLATAAVAGRELPIEWQVDLPQRGLSLRVAAVNPEAWNALTIPYWEGPVRTEGTHSGRGYLEMTGY